MDKHNTHAKSSVAVPLTVGITYARKSATRVAAYPARKILQDRFTALAVTKLSRVCLEGREKAALSQYPSATRYVKDSYPVEGTSASNSVIMMNACAVKRWLTRAVSATRLRQSTLVTWSTIQIRSAKSL